MEQISQLHPAAQVTAIIVLGAIMCTLIWQFFKTVRDMS